MFNTFFSRWTQSDIDTKIKTAILAVSRIFKAPADTTTEDLELLPYLFSSSTECCAYLICVKPTKRLGNSKPN